MSGKKAKAARREARAELGISKAAERAEAEFEALVRRRRAELADQDEIVSLAPKRRALAWAGLALFGLALAWALVAVLR